MRPSLWLDRRRPETPSLLEDLTVDVAVVGAGITGLTAAVELARAGAGVAVLESRWIGAGATGFTSAKVSCLQGARLHRLRRDHGLEATRAYVTANAEAAGWIEERVRLDGVACDHEHRTALTWCHGPDGVAEIEAEEEAARSAGLPVRLEADTDLPFPVAAAVALDDQAQFHPLAYLAGLADLAVRAGAVVHEHTRVRGVAGGRGGGTLRLPTAAAEVTADHVLVCTGIPFVDRGLYFARMEPVRSYVIAVPAPTGAPRSMSISTDDPVRSLRTAIGADGEEVLLVGGGGHTVGRRSDTEGAYEELAQWSSQALGADEVRASWSTQDYVSQDGLPYVGTTWSLPDRVRVATGFAKWGITNGTAAGRLLAGEVLGSRPDWADVFDAGRLGPARSLGRLAKLNGEVGRHFVQDRLRPSAGRPAPREGEGCVYRDGLRLTAASTTDGTTCEVSAICPHLGGVVAWNPAEQSWDCPLHGSRFDSRGNLLQGPSVRDLAPRRISSGPPDAG